MKPYPLKCNPEFKNRVWGGRALEQFGLALPEGPIGEGWMIGDHPNGTTTVANGELAGLGLDRIRELYGKTLFGSKGFSEKNGRFPLLIKLLDCQDDLSVQVHPNDHYERLPQGELGKTEMWYILDAKPGAKIIYGLQEGVTREQLAAAIADNRIMDCSMKFPSKPGTASTFRPVRCTLSAPAYWSRKFSKTPTAPTGCTITTGSDWTASRESCILKIR